jgi:hypothetical protein
MTGSLPGWRDHLATLQTADALQQLLERPDDPALVIEAQRLLFLSLSAGYLSAFADPDLPDFVPAVNTTHNSSCTNPDFIYGAAAVDGTGSYRISGNRGDGLFVFLDIVAGGLGVMEKLGPSLGTIDFDTLTLGPDGDFDLLLSPERPEHWTGDWHALDPAAKSLTLRQARYDWGAGRDGRFAIERIDLPLAPRRRSPEEIAERLTALAAFPQRYAGLWLGFMKGQRDKGLWNALEHDDWAGRGGVQGQHYYQGLFRLAPGEVLLLETDLPDVVRYWNVQLADPVWNTIDWMNRQSSLNGGQAQIDSDARFRAVIALEDPGVPNWLDAGGWSEGAIMLRWTGASNGPAPTLRSIKEQDLRAHLPQDTAIVTAEDRQISLRARRRGVQLRRRW